MKNRIVVQQSSIHEPSFAFDRGSGKYSFVLPGNLNTEGDEVSAFTLPPINVSAQFRGLSSYTVGDKIYKPNGGGGGTASGSNETSVDDFIFVLSAEEYASLMLEGLELPNQEERVGDAETVALVRAGYTMTGTPANLSLLKTMKNSMGRRIGLQRPKMDELQELEEQIQDPNLSEEDVELLLQKISTMKSRLESIPYIDPFDVRYKQYVPEKKPKFKAVMFCLMDVSGSMREREKELAKRFYMILYRFLKMKYEKVEVVFIRYHHNAKVVNEQEFFYGQETGGTNVMSAMDCLLKEIRNHYDPEEWNIYVAQASDGDTDYNDEESDIYKILTEIILPVVNYFAFIQIAKEPNNMYGEMSGKETDLWKTYQKIVKEQFKKFAMREVSNKKEIYPVFRDMFAKKD